MTVLILLLVAASAGAGIYALYQVVEKIPNEFDVHP